MSIAIGVALLALDPRAARADRPALVIAAHAFEGSDGSVERAVRAAVSDLDDVQLRPAPPLDLESVLLAIDCPELSARCLHEVARRMQARVLVIPAIERNSGEVTLTIAYFDDDASEDPTTRSRTRPGDAVDHELLAAVPILVRELFGVAATPATELPPPSGPAPVAEPQPAAAPVDAGDGGDGDGGGGAAAGPLVLGGVALGVIAAGVTVGAMMKSTERDYAGRTIDSESAVLAAERERERGRRQAVVANVLLGAGVAGVVAAGVWLLIDSGGRDGEPAQTALVPMVGPRSAGVSLLGTWEDGG